MDKVVQREPIPTRWSGLVFEGKAWGLRLARAMREQWSGPAPQHVPGRLLDEAPVLAAFEGALWPKDEADLGLVAGKIHNLRLAIVHLHGLEIPAGAVFSFWRQLGRASARRGFVAGRELREGCVVPAIGGGLCQLSNAIYDSAVRAGLEIVERHRHSRVLPGSLAEHDRDATVFWNYLDLRLRAGFAWRLEVSMDEARLRVCIRANVAESVSLLPLQVSRRAVEASNDCSSCGEHACHRHAAAEKFRAHRAWLIDEDWPEFRAYLQHERGSDDRVLGSVQPRPTMTARIARARAWLHWRIALWRKQPIPKARAQRQAQIAQTLAAQLAPDDLHLVVSQGLLPYLWRAGVLAGRRFDVLMSALPMTAIQQQLDRAAVRHPDSPTLSDFRAPAWLVTAEADALAKARLWISPHAGIADLAGARAERLPWSEESAAPATAAPLPASGDVDAFDRAVPVFFPASTLARKGALELREALRDQPIILLLPPGASETPDFWRGFAIERVASFADGLARAGAVVLPAWVEHQPRGLLAAIARGLPVIATAACGLPRSPSWKCVDEGDVDALRAALQQLRKTSG